MLYDITYGKAAAPDLCFCVCTFVFPAYNATLQQNELFLFIQGNHLQYILEIALRAGRGMCTGDGVSRSVARFYSNKG
jgi:hypothetical protein